MKRIFYFDSLFICFFISDSLLSIPTNKGSNYYRHLIPVKLNISCATRMFSDPAGEENRSRIDYIFVNKALKHNIKKVFIIRDEFTHYMSDHYPVFLELLDF